MQQVKVPKEVMELAYEAVACRELANRYGDSFFSFPKAIYYQAKCVKAQSIAERALGVVHPETLKGDWTINVNTGMAEKSAEPTPPAAEAKPKKPRKPRAPKADVKPETKTEGETV